MRAKYRQSRRCYGSCRSVTRTEQHFETNEHILKLNASFMHKFLFCPNVIIECRITYRLRLILLAVRFIIVRTNTSPTQQSQTTKRKLLLLQWSHILYNEYKGAHCIKKADFVKRVPYEPLIICMVTPRMAFVGWVDRIRAIWHACKVRHVALLINLCKW